MSPCATKTCDLPNTRSGPWDLTKETQYQVISSSMHLRNQTEMYSSLDSSSFWLQSGLVFLIFASIFLGLLSFSVCKLISADHPSGKKQITSHILLSWNWWGLPRPSLIFVLSRALVSTRLRCCQEVSPTGDRWSIEICCAVDPQTGRFDRSERKFTEEIRDRHFLERYNCFSALKKLQQNTDLGGNGRGFTSVEDRARTTCRASGCSYYCCCTSSVGAGERWA